MLDNGLIAPGDILWRGQKPELAMFQNVLFVRRKIAAFALAPAARVEKWKEDVPQKILRASSSRFPADAGARPISRPVGDAVDIFFTRDSLVVTLADGRTVSAPLEWFPRLLRATPKQRRNWRLIGRGVGIHWEDVDEDVSVRSLLAH